MAGKPRGQTAERRPFKQIKRLFMLAGVIEAERTCTVQEATELFKRRVENNISERTIRRDLWLLTELGVLEETHEEWEGRVVFRYSFEGWPIAVHD